VPLNPDAVGFVTDPVEVSWASKDCLLYALGVGAGVTDPTGFELEFTTENSEGVVQRCLPTFAVVANAGGGGGGNLYDKIGTFDQAMLVHGEESVEIHQPLPTEGRIRSVTTVTGIYDKGSGGVVAMETKATDLSTGTPMFTIGMSAFIRGEGGFGGDRGPSGKSVPPDRDPDHRVSYRTRTDQALLYRLNGDRNPLHADPKFAARGGFPKPILHGLCTYGFTGRALLHQLCQSDPDRFLSMYGRFSKPVFPGEELTISIWELGDGQAAFQTTDGEGAVVIDSGRCTYKG